MSSNSARKTRWPRVAIIGAGPGGLCMGIRLKKAGLHDFTIFEKADGVGGVWWHNTYPGAACDIPSHLYSFSFELDKEWDRPYASQPEIKAYLERCVDKYQLGPHLRLGTAVTEARWDEEQATWKLRTARGDEFEANILVSGMGMFNIPAFPDLPGLADFEGAQFHSARWDHDHDLTGKRVAVIGTGASAVQFVPQIAPVVEQLHVFQRSPGWIVPKVDTPFTDDEKRRFRRIPLAARRHRFQIWRGLDANLTYEDAEASKGAEAYGLMNLEAVEDPDVRAALTPSDPFGCKRPLISSDYYPTFNRPNVELVTALITHVTPTAVVTADGVERPVDTIIFGTGFKTSEYLGAVDIVGRDGRRLKDAWVQGAKAYLGITTSGFPNLFMLYGPNTNNGSIIFMIERQASYVMRLIQRMRLRREAWVDVSPKVMDRYNVELQKALEGNPAWNAGCHNYYRGPSGNIVTQWPHNTFRYWRETRRLDLRSYESAKRREAAASR